MLVWTRYTSVIQICERVFVLADAYLYKTEDRVQVLVRDPDMQSGKRCRGNVWISLQQVRTCVGHHQRQPVLLRRLREDRCFGNDCQGL